MMTTKKTRTATGRRVAEVAAVSKSTDAIEDIEDFFGPCEALAIRSSLLHWYDNSRRVLPWRMQISDSGGHRNPEDPAAEEQRAYAVWVSEVMLQQTRVPTVIGYYNRWMEKWPTLHDLSIASLEGAKFIAENGVFPRSSSTLRSVRGIGDYTAGAIASIAFNEVVPVVDGNVVRVITRLKAISANPKESRTVKLIW